jgi:hypothetical protein
LDFLDERAVSKDEFANMLISWDIEETNAEKAYDFITEHGKKHMDCTLQKKLLFPMFDFFIFR